MNALGRTSIINSRRHFFYYKSQFIHHIYTGVLVICLSMIIGACSADIDKNVETSTTTSVVNISESLSKLAKTELDYTLSTTGISNYYNTAPHQYQVMYIGKEKNAHTYRITSDISRTDLNSMGVFAVITPDSQTDNYPTSVGNTDYSSKSHTHHTPQTIHNHHDEHSQPHDILIHTTPDEMKNHPHLTRVVEKGALAYNTGVKETEIASYFNAGVAYSSQSNNDPSVKHVWERISTINSDKGSVNVVYDGTKLKLYSKAEKTIDNKPIRTMVWWDEKDMAHRDRDDYDALFEKFATDFIKSETGLPGLYKLVSSLTKEHVWNPPSSGTEGPVLTIGDQRYPLVPKEEIIHLVFMDMDTLGNNILGYVNAGKLFDYSYTDGRGNRYDPGIYIHINSRIVEAIIDANDDMQKAREMLYLYMTIVHELQHISTFYQKNFKNLSVDSFAYPDRWFNEFLSVSAELLLAYPTASLTNAHYPYGNGESALSRTIDYYKKINLYSHVASTFNNVLAPSNQRVQRGVDYNVWRLFTNYLVQNYQNTFFNELFTNKYGDYTSFNTILASMSEGPKNFEELAHAYGVSKIIPTNFQNKDFYTQSHAPTSLTPNQYLTEDPFYTDGFWEQCNEGNWNAYYSGSAKRVDITSGSTTKLISALSHKYEAYGYFYATPVLHNIYNCFVSYFTTEFYSLNGLGVPPLWNSVLVKIGNPFDSNKNQWETTSQLAVYGHTVFGYDAFYGKNNLQTGPFFYAPQYSVGAGSSVLIHLAGKTGFYADVPSPDYLREKIDDLDSRFVDGKIELKVPPATSVSIVVHYYE